VPSGTGIKAQEISNLAKKSLRLLPAGVKIVPILLRLHNEVHVIHIKGKLGKVKLHSSNLQRWIAQWIAFSSYACSA
jgi:hypothetical protein